MTYASIRDAQLDGWRIASYDIASDQIVRRDDVTGLLVEVDPTTACTLQVGEMILSAVRIAGRADA